MGVFIYSSSFDPDLFATFDGSQTVITNDFVMFWKPPSPFGQWTASPFTVDDVDYVCAEQYMMAEKARLFGDAAMEKRIMGTSSPRAQRKLGRRVVGFQDSLWIEKRCDIVFKGNVAKFTQNEDFFTRLMETGSRTLVEASPMDRIWGIGIKANEERAYHPDRWKGMNLLGKVLMEVREHLGRLYNPS